MLLVTILDGVASISIAGTSIQLEAMLFCAFVSAVHLGNRISSVSLFSVTCCSFSFRPLTPLLAEKSHFCAPDDP